MYPVIRMLMRFLEDENGNRYQDSSLYEDKKLMNAERIFMRQETEVSAAPLMLYAESFGGWREA